MDGAIYGRGAADTKSNILMHVGALRAWNGKPPVGIKIVIEGQEEVGSALTTFPTQRPELFAADAMVIGDGGSIRPGVPTLTVGLRAAAGVVVSARTLAGPKHSGQFGGAAPDALLALLRALASLHDDAGDVAVAGLQRDAWDGASYADDEFRSLAEVQVGVPLIGTGGLGERLWSGPALTVSGLDAPPVDRAVNAVVPFARAKINARFHPAQDPHEGQAAVIRHLEAQAPFGIALDVEAAETGSGFLAKTSGPAYDAARAALGAAWGAETVTIATGGSIPLGADTLRGSDAVLASITKSWAGLASLLFLFLLIAQFIAYFNYSNMAQVAAASLGDWLESADIGALWLLIGFVFITAIVNFIMPAAIAKWAILAPIFISLFLRLDVAPQTVLAGYRVGDSPSNVITPLMAYFPLIVIFARRYKKNAGIGTVVSMMLPFVVVLSVVWTLFFVAWYLVGIPLGPGSPVHLD